MICCGSWIRWNLIFRKQAVLCGQNSARSSLSHLMPDAFLRRCIFHYIEFPDEGLMSQIIRVHYPDLEDAMLTQVLKAFYQLRAMNGLQNKPGSSELLDWIQALLLGGVDPACLHESLPFVGALLKKNEDIELVRRRQE